MSDLQTGPEIRVVALGPGDFALFESLMSMFGDAFEEPDTYTGRQPGADYVSRLLADETFIALAAIDGDAVVGGLAAYVLRKFERERSEVFVYDLAVAATHRRRGIATALFDTLGKVAAERGAYVIFVQADQGDTPAIELYTKLGRREDVLHFDIAVPGADGG